MKHAPKFVVMALAGLAGTAQAQMFEDTFELGANQGRWTLGCKGEHIEFWSGYNGAYLRGRTTGIPEIRTRGDSGFTGDWSSRQVTVFCFAIGVYEHTGPSNPLTLVIRTDNGTPANPEDDWAAYVTPENQVPPQAGEMWWYISFFVPSLDQVAPPSRWRLMNLGQTPPAVRDWRVLIRHVSELKVLFAAPGMAPPGGPWDFGVDDMRVEPVVTEAVCYPNCDGSTTPPRLNANDFQCFLHSYAAGCFQPPPNCYANCDESTGTPLLNANDFQCFLNKYAEGCT